MSQAANTTLRQLDQRVARHANRAPSGQPQRVYALNLARSIRPPPPDLLPWIAGLGFDTLLLAGPRHASAHPDALPPIARAAIQAGLRVELDLTLDMVPETADIVARHPDWYRVPPRQSADPRVDPMPSGLRVLDPRAIAAGGGFTAYWADTVRQGRDHGIAGYRCKPGAAIAPDIWRDLIAASPDSRFSVWTQRASPELARALPRGCFDVAYNGLARWDFAAEWFGDELARLRLLAPIANTVGLPESGARSLAPAARRQLDVAARIGHGLLLGIGFEFGIPSNLDCPQYGADDWTLLRDHARLDLSAAVREANQRVGTVREQRGAPAILSSAHAPVAVLFEQPARITLANRRLDRPTAFDLAGVLPMLDGKLGSFADDTGQTPGLAPLLLAPGEARGLTGSPVRRIVTAEQQRGGETLAKAVTRSRVAIEAIEPAVDQGRFAVKRVTGERITVSADVFSDGHGKISAAMQWRAGDETAWRETAMRQEGNDRWSAEFLLERVGPWLFRVVAWPDRFETFRDELTKKHDAGLDVTLELEEGRLLIESIDKAGLASLLASLKDRDATARVALLTGAETAGQVARADTRPGSTISAEMRVEADRRAAEFAAWYELFPRNQSGDPARHGTFRDVIKRLPAIRDMGFDVLYFPPIHPIGRTNRKGRDNTLTPAKDDPGSPYAIGAPEGGHDAIHPELGTIDDFRALRDAAAAHGLELALDFAIQCSPDHPWLRQHPEWFDWRPDGGLRYAENPPKKYEDIVNVDFHQPGAIPGLWQALRDVVAFWAKEGVRVFRVDNPHTKPFAFWEWMIADIRAHYPDALFFSEAFTRPKVMYRLAKLGFSQSYTYFTWRNEKWEIQAYLRELTGGEPLPGGLGGPLGVKAGTNVVDFFRPNFFVNTPDINPVFLQNSGRPGFLIRAALATTLSGLWGMLQGFEFCEAEPVPGREEYAHSDKYEIRIRPDRAPGDIVDEITKLNAIRRANPALQSHRRLAFHTAENDRVLWYRKANVDRSNVVLVAVSLDPFAPQTARVEAPLWEWGLGDDAALVVEDLMRGGEAVWQGKFQTISLDPAMPFGIWRARPREIS